MCVTSDQIKHAHFHVIFKEHQTDWTLYRGDFSMKNIPLANVMLGIATIIATTLQMVPAGIIITGLGLMTLHAFGLASPPS